jgi:hypothetical protein
LPELTDAEEQAGQQQILDMIQLPEQSKRSGRLSKRKPWTEARIVFEKRMIRLMLETDSESEWSESVIDSYLQIKRDAENTSDSDSD